MCAAGLLRGAHVQAPWKADRQENSCSASPIQSSPTTRCMRPRSAMRKRSWDDDYDWSREDEKPRAKVSNGAQSKSRVRCGWSDSQHSHPSNITSSRMFVAYIHACIQRCSMQRPDFCVRHRSAGVAACHVLHAADLHHLPGHRT